MTYEPHTKVCGTKFQFIDTSFRLVADKTKNIAREEKQGRSFFEHRSYSVNNQLERSVVGQGQFHEFCFKPLQWLNIGAFCCV